MTPGCGARPIEISSRSVDPIEISSRSGSHRDLFEVRFVRTRRIGCNQRTWLRRSSQDKDGAIGCNQRTWLRRSSHLVEISPMKTGRPRPKDAARRVITPSAKKAAPECTRCNRTYSRAITTYYVVT